MSKLYYGAAYYDEYMPYERLSQDITMMRRAGMNVVRIGESTWSTFEPQEGVFDFSHLDHVIEAFGGAGIDVILGTPTYAIPTWMVASYPDVLATTRNGRGIYGPRQIMDITNKAYLFYAERAIRKMMEHCLPYSNVIGVQIDNETKAYGTAGHNVQQGFLKYLREKFGGDLEAMNHEFGLDYWSNRINSWEDFPDVRGTINASLGAEFEKYQRSLVTDFFRWQRQIIEEYLRPDQFITHNTDFNWKGYSYGINGDTDAYANAQQLTIVGTDIYHPSQDALTGMEIAFGGDVTRSLKKANYFVLETEAQGFPEWLPFDGQLRLQAYSHLASGANLVEYWHWHSLHNAIETYWKGVLSQDFKENDTYRAASVVGNEWQRIGDHLVNLKKHNRVAILVSNEALTALNWFPIDGMRSSYHYNDVLMEVYRALYELGIECDFLWPQNAAEEMGQYALVLIPALYAASEELLLAIDRYVREGGHVFSTFKTAFANEHVKVYSDETPHILSKAFGVAYSHFTVPQNVCLSVGGSFAERLSPQAAGEAEITASHFMELLEPLDEDAEVLLRYDHPSWGRYAAAVHHPYGRGEATYLGCGVSGGLLEEIISYALEHAGLSPARDLLPSSRAVKIRRGTNDYGKEIIYCLNYSGQEVSVRSVLDRPAKELLSGKTVAAGETISIGAWGLLILEADQPR